MRCAGTAGVKHYFHKQCLGSWVQRQMESGTTPTCPICRGSVLVNVDKLSAFLDSQQAADLPAEEVGALRMLLARARVTLGTASQDESWAEPFDREDAMYAGLIAGAAAAGFYAGYADGPGALVAEAGVILAPTPMAQAAGMAGWVTGLTARGVQAILEHHH